MLQEKFKKHHEILQDQIDLYRQKVIVEERVGSFMDHQISYQIELSLEVLLRDFAVLKGLHDEGKFSQEELMVCYKKYKRCTRELLELWDNELKLIGQIALQNKN